MITAYKQKQLSNKITFDQLCSLLGVSSLSDLEEDFFRNQSGASYSFAYSCAIQSDKSEEEAEEIAREAEGQDLGEYTNKYILAVESVAGALFNFHYLNLIETKTELTYRIVPMHGWAKAANEIIRTINGVGMFYFSSLREFFKSGPYTSRSAVLEHLHHIPYYYEVYEGSKARSMVEKKMRW